MIIPNEIIQSIIFGAMKSKFSAVVKKKLAATVYRPVWFFNSITKPHTLS